MKRLSLSLMLLALVALPLAPGVAAGDSAEWDELSSIQSWEYDSYRTERLLEDSTNLQKFGDHLVLIKRAQSCRGACDLRDLYVFSNGGVRLIEDVPTIAVKSDRYLQNGQRIVYAENANDDGTRINVVEVDLESGGKTEILSNEFIGEVDTIDIMMDGDMIYAVVTFDRSNSNDLDKQSSVFVYNPRYNEFKQMYRPYKLEYEDLLDVEDGQAVVRVTFDGGEEQLWVYDYVEYGEQSAHKLPDTWTVNGEDIVAAHFADQGDIEYFRMYARQVTDAKRTATYSYDDYLNWYRQYNPADLSNLVQIRGEYMAFVDPNDDLYVSDGDKPTLITNITAAGSFRLLDESILWDNGTVGGLSTLAGIEIKSFDFAPTDMLANLVVGVDAGGNIKLYNLYSGNEMTLGYGQSPYLSDARHLYFVGEDGSLYEATLFLSNAFDTSVGQPVKTADSSKVYMLLGNTLAYIPNEMTYFTWFDSFSEVVEISEEELVSYQAASDLSMKPGTKVKVDGSSKVYVIGDDGQLHWIVSQAVATDLYGENWNQAIVSMSQKQVIGYGYGSSISSENELSKTVMIATVK